MPQINKLEVISFPLIRSISFSFKLSWGLKFLFLFMLLVIFSLLIVSVYQLNAYTAEVYFIQDAERKINEISQENKILEINLAQANSLLNVENYVHNFEKVNKIEYIHVLEGTALAR